MISLKPWLAQPNTATFPLDAVIAALRKTGKHFVKDELLNDLATARRLLASTRTVLVDVRPSEEFEHAHLPGAVNVPLDSLRGGGVPLPEARHYVVYCRGPYCLFADEAVAILQKRGLRATRLALGTIEWAAAGEPLERAI